ncbi:MAG: TetR/AcrR family transcriptional regulator [Oculatellaceae cyanobacterium Prado106]|jgi:AcrR family transcriptional regulator|nr:TetR/AcrR family transcriptional regulator [Oculatellaceae cyanobacterium Prado106]
MMNIEKYHHGHLREALINEAYQQIEQEGAIALNLSKLSQKIGVSQPSVYRHFPNKQALAIRVAQRGFEQLAEALQKATRNAESDAFEGIRAIATAYVEFALNHPEIARLMFSMKERTTEPVLQNASKAAAVPLFRIVEAAKHCDRLRNHDVEQAVRIIWAAIHGLAMLLMDEQIPSITRSTDQLSEHIEATARALHLGLFVM